MNANPKYLITFAWRTSPTQDYRYDHEIVESIEEWVRRKGISERSFALINSQPLSEEAAEDLEEDDVPFFMGREYKREDDN